MKKVKIFSLCDYVSTEDMEESINSFIAKNSLSMYTLVQSESQVLSTTRSNGGAVENKYHLSLTITLDYEVKDESSCNQPS